MTQRWPTIAPQSLTEGMPPIVLAPHPDDESLGCGALLAHAFGTTGAHVICMTDGGASHPGSRDWPRSRLVARRRIELEQAVAKLGGTPEDITWLGLPDGQLHARSAQDIANQIVPIVSMIGAASLFAPAIEDHHADHKATAGIALLVAAALPGLSIYSYPVWSRWDDPNFANTISRHQPVWMNSAPDRSLKQRAINKHSSQLQGGITDDPTGFSMEPAFIDLFVNEDEIFWRTHP